MVDFYGSLLFEGGVILQKDIQVGNLLEVWWFFRLQFWTYLDVSKNYGTPKWMVYFMENPIKHGMIWGYHYFWKHPFGCLGYFSNWDVIVVLFFKQLSFTKRLAPS